MKVLSTDGLTKLITLCKQAFLTREDAESVYTVDVDGDITEADTVEVEEVNPEDVFSDWGGSLHGDVVTTASFIHAYQKCYQNQYITSFSAPNATIAYMSSCFYGCSSLTTASFDKLEAIGERGFAQCFYGCTSLTTIYFTKLSSIETFGLSQAFQGTSILQNVYFNSLTTQSFLNINAFASMLVSSGSSVTHTLHFPSNLEATVQGLTGYPTFGGTSGYVTLAFDLPATS